MPYENEFCDSCRYYLDVDFCAHKEMKGNDYWPDLSDRCELFSPSLGCRKVRALESIADNMGDFRKCLRMDDSGGYTFDVTR